MAKESKIQWTDATVNFWTGCKKVSEGCKFCYMYRDKERYGHDPTDVIRTSDKTFKQALKWSEPKLIFTCSWSDFFIEEADQWRDEAWEVIRQTPHHTWQILTKRPERILDCLPDDWGDGYDNVWIGVSVENQKNAEERIPLLIDVPCKVRFLSCEPLLGYVNIDWGIMDGDIHWVIIGGESGNDTGKWRYRPCDLRMIWEIVDCCRKHKVPVFVKQLGTYLSKMQGLKDRHGGDMDEWKETWAISVREMPLDYQKKEKQ